LAALAAPNAHPELDQGLALDAFDELKTGCEKFELSALQEPEKHPDRAIKALAGIHETCFQVKQLDYWTLMQSTDLASLIEKSHWQVRTLRDYYESIRNDPFSPMGTIAATWESLRYFENYSQSMLKARDPSQGSQDRINFRDLMHDLRIKLADYAFKKMLQNNRDKLINHGFMSLSRPSTQPIQKEAIKSMISICQTLDPTLACLFAEQPKTEKLFKSWVVRCVGPKSDLCKNLVERNLGDLERLIDDPKRWTYLQSLCNFPTLPSPIP
jgi:hypothetical protein